MGRIQCPNCLKHFDEQQINDIDDTLISCPFCKHQFNIHPIQSEKKHAIKKEKEECSWEAHGEPRKTILSSIKPRTDRPMIATFLLLIVVCLGIIASITPELFLQTPVNVFSATGFEGSLIIQYENFDPVNINQTTLILDQDTNITIGTFTNKSIIFENLPLGKSKGQLTIIEINQNNTETFDFFILPFFDNSYKISSDNQNNIQLSHNGFEWCTIILLILSVICLIGMFSAWRRNYSDVALFGSFIGIFTIGFFFIGSILSIIAFYLIYQSRDEFDDGKKGKSF